MATSLLFGACSGDGKTCDRATQQKGNTENVIGRSDIKVKDGRMTPEVLWAMGRIGGMNVSPDGQKVVYTVAYYSVPENRSNREVFVMNADGTDNKQITKTSYSENEAGGMLMYKDNAFGDWLPDEFYGLHVRPDLKVGDIATNTGTLFAGTCEVKITFTGKGGHAAFPHEANDALVAASYFITQVQSVVSRNVDPIEGAVVTFGSMHAGTTNNVIAETAFLHGTIRTLTMEMNLLTQKRVKAIAEGVAAAFDVKLDLELKQGGYLPVENQPEMAKELMDFFTAEEDVNLIDILPAMTGEDFGFLLSKVPGVMFWLGIDTPYALHHPKMSPNEAALPFAVENIGKFLKMKANQ